MLGNCTKLYHLTLSNNLLTGDIPPGLGNYTSLKYLSLSSNLLTGDKLYILYYSTTKNKLYTLKIV